MPFIPPVRPSRLEPAEAADVRLHIRKRLGVAQDAILILSIGNLNPQKGFEDLLDVARALRGSALGVELRIRGETQAGHETYAASLRQKALALGLAPETVGALEEGLSVADVMTSADIFVLASRAKSEGLPTVVLEAMSAGLSVVTTDVGSIAEVVEDGRSGVVVPPSNRARLAIALRRLIDSPEERHRLGRAGKDAVDHLADPATFADLQERAYRVAASRHVRRTGARARKRGV